ncbi:MAG TPA: hypothetical protein VF131_03850 [Blastocatellia bacterium]|nr:hypothetical protein [Blastocatellia bacterium]
MLPIRGLYEIAIRVKDLERAESFYREVLATLRLPPTRRRSLTT